MNSRFTRSTITILRQTLPAALMTFALLGLVAAFVLLLVTRTAAFRANVINADLLVPADIYNAFMQGKDISTWAWSAAAYWFPDFAIYFPIRFVTGDFQSAAVWYAVAQVLLFAVGLMALGRQIIPDYRRTYDALAVALATLYVSGIPSLWMIMTPALLAIDIHGGLTVGMAVTLALALRGLQASASSKDRALIACALTLFAIALTASDLLYVVEVVAPLTIALVPTYAWMRPWRRAIAINVSALSVGCLSGFLMDRSLRSYMDNVTIMFAPNRAQLSLIALVSSVQSEATARPVHALLLVVFVLLAIIVAVRRIPRRAEANARDMGAFVFAVFVVAHTATTLAFVVGTGIFFDRAGLRYFLPLLALSSGWGLPYVLVPLCRYRYPLWVPRIAAATAIAISVAAIGDLGAHWPRRDQLTQLVSYYPPSVSCLDERLSGLGVRDGVATYWQARPTALLSRSGLQLTQVSADLSPFYWETGLYAYDIEPQFILIDRNPGMPAQFVIDETQVQSRFGQPAAVIDCPSSRALIYGRPEDTALRALFTSALGPVRFRHAGDAYTYRPANLPGAVGHVDSLGRIVSGGAAGFLTFGPYVKLPPGDYVFTIDYGAQSDRENIGSWDVAISYPGGNVIAASGSIPTQGVQTRDSFGMTETGVVEIRVLYGGQGTLTVTGIQLTKVR